MLVPCAQYKKLVQEAKQEISDTKDVDTEGTDATKDLISDTEATDAAMIVRCKEGRGRARHRDNRTTDR